jgi:hypothetical protein
MNRTIAAVKSFAFDGTVLTVAPFAITGSIAGSVYLAGNSAVFATLAAMQIALLFGIAAGRLAANRRLAFAH